MKYQVVAFLLAAGLGGAQANPVQFRGFEFYAREVAFNGNTYTCDFQALVNCAEVSINAFGDTANVQPFSVPGASGFILPGVTATVNISVVTGPNPTDFVDFQATFDPSDGINVAVDQTNGGVGFGSIFGPTYPMGTYGGAPLATYAGYDLTTNFSVSGFGPFCPTGTTYCSQLDFLATDRGPVAIQFTGPEFSDFNAIVQPGVTAIPEPSGVTLLAPFGLLMFGGAACRWCRTHTAPY
jgi:hypothetical protein